MASELVLLKGSSAETTAGPSFGTSQRISLLPDGVYASVVEVGAWADVDAFLQRRGLPREHVLGDCRICVLDLEEFRERRERAEAGLQLMEDVTNESADAGLAEI